MQKFCETSSAAPILKVRFQQSYAMLGCYENESFQPKGIFDLWVVAQSRVLAGFAYGWLKFKYYEINNLNYSKNKN